jgi:hypothetical protein
VFSSNRFKTAKCSPENDIIKKFETPDRRKDGIKLIVFEINFPVRQFEIVWYNSSVFGTVWIILNFLLSIQRPLYSSPFGGLTPVVAQREASFPSVSKKLVVKKGRE